MTAYWLPSDNGSVEKAYLYQDGVYIGEAENREKYAYNECEAERTESDAEAMLHQQKRVAKFDKWVKERRAELPKVGHMDAELAEAIGTTPLEVVPEVNEQPQGYEEDEWNAEDYAALAISRL